MNDKKKSLRLMCEWDFVPNHWAGIGFHEEDVQKEIAAEKTIIAIYVVKNARDIKKRHKVVGFVEISGKMDCIDKFVSDSILRHHRRKRDNKKRWPHAVGISRAWDVIGFEQQNVKTVFSKTYNNNNPRNIGMRTVIVDAEDFANIKKLRIEAVEVYQPPNGLPSEKYVKEEYATAGDLLKSRGLLEE